MTACHYDTATIKNSLIFRNSTVTVCHYDTATIQTYQSSTVPVCHCDNPHSQIFRNSTMTVCHCDNPNFENFIFHCDSVPINTKLVTATTAKMVNRAAKERYCLTCQLQYAMASGDRHVTEHDLLAIILRNHIKIFGIFIF